MSRFKRKEAFLLPLALIALLVTSVIAINGYTFIQNHILSIQNKYIQFFQIIVSAILNNHHSIDIMRLYNRYR